MPLGAKINSVRRRIMRGLTRNVGKNNKSYALIDKNAGFSRILICRPNSRLGNQLLITPLVEEVAETFPGCKIDLFVRGGLAHVLFENYENVDRIIKLPGKPFKNPLQYARVWMGLRKYRYDMVINVDKNSSSGRLSTMFAKAKVKIFYDNDQLQSQYPDYIHMAKFPVYNFRHFVKNLGAGAVNKPVPPLNLRLSKEETAKAKTILDGLGDPAKKTICLYTFATGAKCYSPEWWKNVYETLKARYGERYNIIEVLPKENVSQIDFAAPSFYGTDIREIGALMANTAIFIGADSGIMHLASAAGVPVVGLFSVTDSNRYGPYNGGSVSFDTNTLTAEDLVKAVDRILDSENYNSPAEHNI